MGLSLGSGLSFPGSGLSLLGGGLSFPGSGLTLSGVEGNPNWAFNFLLGQRPTGSTFTRGSSGWYFNSSGVIVSASTNVARFDYDPATLAPLGYLTEMQSTNAITQSQALTATGWTSANLTVTDNVQVAPDGTTTGATIRENSATSAHKAQYDPISPVSGSVYGVSVFAKNISGSRWLQLNVTGLDYVNFQPSTGTIGSLSANASNAVARQLANGWWRFSFFYTAPATATTSLRLYTANASDAVGGVSYAGDGTSTIAVWGVQFETAGVGVTSYIPTAGSTVTRSQDILSLPLTSLPGWNASKGGVLVATYRLFTLVPSTPGNNQIAASIDDGSNNNRVQVVPNNAGAGTMRGIMASGGISINQTGGTSSSVFVRRKQATGWNTNLVQVAYDGTLLGDTSGTLALPVSPTTLNIGRALSENLNGTLKSIAYYAGARSDAFVQAVSR